MVDAVDEATAMREVDDMSARFLTNPVIEDAVAGIANIDFLTSTSAEGQSTVTITFTDAANVDTAINALSSPTGTTWPPSASPPTPGSRWRCSTS